MLRGNQQSVSQLKVPLSLTSKANRLLHLHPLRARHGHQSPLFPPHQAHGDYVTDRILPGLHSNHTAKINDLFNETVKETQSDLNKLNCLYVKASVFPLYILLK